MWIELLIGVVVVAVLWTQREHMASGVYVKSTPPTDAEVVEIFDQIMAMAPSILHAGYTDALVLARSAVADGTALATKYPDEPTLKTFSTISDDMVVMNVKRAAVMSVTSFGLTAKQANKEVTEEFIKNTVEDIYKKLNEHIDDKVPPFGQTDTPVHVAMHSTTLDYAERARSLVKKYDTVEVRDACALVLKAYYIDQLKPGWSPSTSVRASAVAPVTVDRIPAADTPATPASDPTAVGNMKELEKEYQQRKVVYDNLVADALAKNDASKADAIALAKQGMKESLSKMLALSATSGSSDQQDELIRRIMEIQRDYNGLLVATDKLETLRKIHQFQDSKTDVNLKIYGLGFLIASFALLVAIVRKS